jgi:non-ribosomal peptide synthase protein (TIGR01720 family)
VLRRVKEQLRAVPQGGIGWGLLCYLNARTAGVLQALPPAQLSFNYLGRFDESSASGWCAAAESSGPAIAPQRGREHLLEVVSAVRGGTLVAEWRYWPAAHDHASVADLAERFMVALRGLIRHCTTRGVGGFTPSDFPMVRLTEARLDTLHRIYPDIDDIWPLAPMQHVMLTHARRSPDSVAYYEQLCLTLDGELDAAALEAAWTALTERHATLRVAMADDDELPVQVVRRDPRLPWHVIDCSELGPDVAERRLQDLLADDRRQGFDLASGTLLRASLLRLATDRHIFVLSFHHIVLDGWSIPLLLNELMELYSAARWRRPANLPAPQRYSDYLAWQVSADLRASRAFWQERLGGAALPHRLDLPQGDGTATPDQVGEHRVMLPEQLTARLQELAQTRRLTQNVLIQGAWALALARCAEGGREVLFGMMTSGRPAELPGVERIVGLCTNILPRRVRFTPSMRMADWLTDLQARQAEEQVHDRCLLSDIQRWSGVPADEALFESVVVFENYPIAASPEDETADRARADVRITGFESFEQGVDFPLCLVVAPGAQMGFRLIFGRRRFDAAAIRRLLDDVVSVLGAFAADPGRQLATLREDLADANAANAADRGLSELERMIARP